MSGDSQLGRAIDDASEYLLQQAVTGFAEARHEMTFPRAAGFTGPEHHSADVFARAVLGSLLLDVADIDQGSPIRAAEFRRIARREADYVASRRLVTRHGGWSYFPDLPELPPDVDSLAAALSLFARVAPEHLTLCIEPVRTVLAGVAEGRSFDTWIVVPADSSTDRARMTWGITHCWGTGTDADVLANVCHALLVAEWPHTRAWLESEAARLVSLQEADGAWRGTWYWGDAYGTALAVRFLRAVNLGEAAVQKAIAFLRRVQRDDGAWGRAGPLPLETAVSAWVLETAERGTAAERVDAGCEWLLQVQNPDGSWFSSPWIQMPIGRATGRVTRLALHENVTVTTAFCLRTLTAVRARPRRADSLFSRADLPSANAGAV